MQGATEDQSNGLVSRWRMVGLISVFRIQRTVSVGNTEESVVLRALHNTCLDVRVTSLEVDTTVHSVA